MFKKIMVAGFVLFSASQAVYAQDSTQAAVNEAGKLRIVQIRNRVNSQRDQIKKALAEKTISKPQAKSCSSILDQVDAQLALIAGSGTMPADYFDSYNSFLDVNASLIRWKNQRVAAGKNLNGNA
jgi:hypothetical protein